MEKLLKSKSGIAAIAVILILVVAVGAGGATVLAVRMVVTGEDYLQPFIDLGLISGDTANDDSEEVEETIATSGRLIEFSSDIEARLSAEGVTHYEVTIDSEKLNTVCMDVMSALYSDDDTAKAIIDEILELSADIYDGVEFITDIYADENELIEVVFYTDYEGILKLYYELALEEYPDDLEDEGIESYDDFVDYINSSIDENEIFDELVENIIAECGDYIDYTEKELKELMTFKLNTKNNELELAIEIPDELNENIADVVNEYWNELIDTLEEYESYMSLVKSYYGINIKYDTSILDEDEYVGSIIYFCEDLVNSLEDGLVTVTEK